MKTAVSGLILLLVMATAVPGLCQESSNVVNSGDLRLLINDHNSTFEWKYVIPGDYDQNGEVNISDITPLASFLGAHGPFETGSIEEALDGDGNGEINVADISVIGAHFGIQLSDYEVYMSSDTQLSHGVILESSWHSKGLAQNDGAPFYAFQVNGQLDSKNRYWIALSSNGTVSRSSVLGGDAWPPDLTEVLNAYEAARGESITLSVGSTVPEDAEVIWGTFKSTGGYSFQLSHSISLTIPAFGSVLVEVKASNKFGSSSRAPEIVILD